MKSRFHRVTLIGVLGASLVAGVAGCADTAEAPTMAQPMSGWDTTTNVSRSGRFTFASQPTEASLERFAREGGAMVVDLRTHEGADTPGFDERAKVDGLGMKYMHIPISGSSLSAEDVEQFSRAAKEAHGPIFIHCASSNRAGALWAAYLARDKGLPTEEAIAEGRAAGMRSAQAEEAARRVIGR